MIAIDYNDIVQVNLKLEEAHLMFKVRPKNEMTACIEPLGQCACDGKVEDAVACIKKYYQTKGYQAEITEDNLYFQVTIQNVHHGRYNMDVADLNVYGIEEKAKQHMKSLKEK